MRLDAANRSFCDYVQFLSQCVISLSAFIGIVNSVATTEPIFMFLDIAFVLL